MYYQELNKYRGSNYFESEIEKVKKNGVFDLQTFLALTPHCHDSYLRSTNKLFQLLNLNQ